MKKVLIISPCFPPTNAADMQRVRMSVPYFNEYGWDVEVVKVRDQDVDMNQDEMLLKSIPESLKIHEISALSKRWTSKFGLGSIALRSLWHYRKYVTQLLKEKHFDLIYFSTTQFPVCILGAYWKKKFNIPFVIDMQDPWHSDYYQDKPKSERPKKYWFSYRLNKYLEPIAMKQVDGLISVSQSYLDVLQERYPHIQSIPQKVITFGAFYKDFEVVEAYYHKLTPVFQKEEGCLQLAYIGRGGFDLQPAVKKLLESFKLLLEEQFEFYSRFRFNFIGTSYAPNGQGQKTLFPIAEALELAHYVTEQTDRIPYFQVLRSLKEADGLLVLGSEDPQYTASKIYPYIMADKPLLAILHPKSSAYSISLACKAGKIISIYEEEVLFKKEIKSFLLQCQYPNKYPNNFNQNIFIEYSASEMCKRQVELFNQLLK